MEKNEFGIILPSSLGYDINIAMLKGDTEALFSLLVSYLEMNDLDINDAASVFRRVEKLN